MKSKPALFLLLFLGTTLYGQMHQYHYLREVTGITGQWHRLTLPDEMFCKVSPALSDVRLFGISASRDTIEIPYIWRIASDKTTRVAVDFKLLNQTHNGSGFFYTFQLPDDTPVNHLSLAFGQANFDWRVDLQGSEDQQTWFTIVEGYRILSIKNELTDYQFTGIAFAEARYRFLRLRIAAAEKPRLVSAKLIRQELLAGHYREYQPAAVHTGEDKEKKLTSISVTLKTAVPVSRVAVAIQDNRDYYRPVRIDYPADSVKTAKGWKYSYRNLTAATLSSVDSNRFEFNTTILRKLRIHIQNQDNQPLGIAAVTVSGPQHELVARFGESPGACYLVYGNEKALRPQYDISRFQDRIPPQLTALVPGAEQEIAGRSTPVTRPLFQNALWLWAVMLLIILLLGWFSLQMMRKAT